MEARIEPLSSIMNKFKVVSLIKFPIIGLELVQKVCFHKVEVQTKQLGFLLEVGIEPLSSFLNKIKW